MKPLLIIKTGETMPHLRRRRGDFEDWISAGVATAHREIRVVAPFKGDPLPPPRHASGVIITGSHAMVTHRNDWSEKTAAWIPQVIAAQTPLLGICYGHQLMAHALGGRVGSSPVGVEIGTVEISFEPGAADDPLFGGLPRRIRAHASHAESVVQLPPRASVLATSPQEPVHAFSIGSAAWGIQFHPEFDADIMTTYVREFEALIRASGQDPRVLRKTIQETPHSRSVLVRFAEIVRERDQG